MADTIIIKNLTGGDITFNDLGAITVPASSQLDITNALPLEQIFTSADLKTAIDNDYVVINDGTYDLSKDCSYEYVSYQSKHNPLLHNIQTTGILSEGKLSINTDTTKFDISAGVGIVVNNYTDPLNPTHEVVTWTAKTALTVTNLATHTATYVAINSSGAVIQQTTSFTADQTRDLIILGKLVHPNKTTIASTNPTVQTAFDSLEQLYDFCRTIGPLNISGNEYSANGSNMSLNKSAGSVFRIGSNYDASNKNPSIYAGAEAAATPWTYYYRSAAPGVWTAVPSASSIDPDYYDDDSGTLQAVTSGYWTIQTIFQFAGTNRTVVQYGQSEYSTLEVALSERTTSFDVNPILEEACFRCWLFVKQGATDLSDSAEALFVTAGKFGLINVVSSSIGGEVNTASNQGSLGTGPFYQKSGVDLQFKNIAPNSTKIAVTDDAVNHNIKVDVVPGNIMHQDLDGKGTNTHAQIDTHVGSTSNPHAVTKTQVSLGNVTDDAQLKRAAGDLNSFSQKNPPVGADVLIVEDSAASYAKKKVLINTVPHGQLANIGTNTHAQIDTHVGSTSNPHAVTKTQVGLSNVTNDAQIAKSIGTTKGDLIGFSASATPVRVGVGTNNYILTADSAEASGVKWAVNSGGTYGSYFYRGVSATDSSTTSGTYQQKLRVTTGSLPSGTYRIGFYYEWQKSGVTDFASRVQVNDTDTIMEGFEEAVDAGSDQWFPRGGFGYYTGSGVLNIDLDYHSGGSDTAYIRRARIEIWRVS